MNVMQLLLKRYRRKINKVIKGGVVLSILFSIISLLIPPFNIYADDYTGSTVVGFDVNLKEITPSYAIGNTSNVIGYNYIYQIEITLDKNYLGYLQVGGTVNYYGIGSSTLQSFTLNSRNRFVNGNKIIFTFKISGDGYTATDRPSLNNVNLTYGSHNLTSYDLISSIEDIINILNDLYSNTDGIEGLMNDEIDQLELIVDSIGLSNQYLQTLNNLRQWHPYIESYPFIITLFKRNYNTVDLDFNNTSYTNYLDYPIFIIPSGSVIENRQMYNSSDKNDYYIVFGTNESINNINDFQTYFNFSSGSGEFTLTYQSIWVSSEFRIIKITVHCVQSGIFTITAKDSQRYFMPIVSIRKDQANFSTEFALRFKFSNSLLDSLNIIANGTIQSNSSSNSLEIQKDTFDTTSNNLYTSENAFNTDMNNKLQSIDTSFNPSTSFGSKFLSSADWVRTQFNNLTSTSPFGTVLSFSMLLGLSLLIIGKVFK